MDTWTVFILLIDLECFEYKTIRPGNFGDMNLAIYFTNCFQEEIRGVRNSQQKLTSYLLYLSKI